MSFSDRNQLIGDKLGMTAITQCWIGIKGKRFWMTPHAEDEREKAQALIDYFTKSDKNWAYFVKEKKGACDEMRHELEVVVERWHMRYSDTPGGGWNVIEWLAKRGEVTVCSEGEGWRVTLDDKHPNHGRITETFPTMAEAACVVALRFLSNGRDEPMRSPNAPTAGRG